MTKGFQCDKCGKMFIGGPVSDLKVGDYEAIYRGQGDICRPCFLKGFAEAIKPPKKERSAV